jgi:hypothetical protein
MSVATDAQRLDWLGEGDAKILWLANEIVIEIEDYEYGVKLTRSFAGKSIREAVDAAMKKPTQ